MRRSTVLSLPAQLVFPAQPHEYIEQQAKVRNEIINCCNIVFGQIICSTLDIDGKTPFYDWSP